MQRKLTGGRSWWVTGIAAGVLALPLSLVAMDASSTLQLPTSALTTEELRTAFASTTAAPAGQRRVQVGPRDTLWSIARTNRPSNNITIKQAMLAIRDANPRAFPSGNINEMESGSSLVIPSAAAMRQRTALQAEQEVRRQNQAWVASRDQTPSRPVPVSETRPATPRPSTDSPPVVAPERVETRPRDLQLVSPPAASTAQQERIKQLEGRLSASEESLQLAEREKDELAERITEMQQQVNTLQQLIRLKDEQLADMERQLTQRMAQPHTPPAAPVQAQPAAAEALPQDLMGRIQQQPGLYGALGGSLLLLLAMFFAWLSARSQLKSARQQNSQTPDETKLEADMLAAHNATSSDFDLDLNAKPLDQLESLDELEDLDDLDQLELDDGGLSTELDLDDLNTALETTPEPNQAQAVERKEKQRDPMQEAEMFIAYGRLEQAAGYLQNALAAQPEREDLRLKLLEVLVELNDEETFNKQRAELEASSPSASAQRRVAELTALFAVATPAAAMIENSLNASSDTGSDEMELGEMDLGEMDLDDLALDDLDELDLDDDQAIASIFGSEKTEMTDSPSQASSSVEMDFQVDDSQDDLEDIPLLGGLEDFDDLDSLEAELDEVISSKPPVAPTPEEDLVDPLEGLEELDEFAAEELELDLEKPIEADELSDDFGASNDFEPVDYKSDADDFMSALDSLELDDLPETEEPDVLEQKQAPGVNEELAALSSDLSELENLTADPDEPFATADTDDLMDLSDLSDLGDLDDIDLGGAEGDLRTQLDLATAYIEMGDKEGARELLDKVIREGDADLRATAQQMLEALTG